MKKEKLLHKLQAFFDTDNYKKRQHIKELKKILIKLKKKERKIAHALLQTDDDCLIKQYQTELEIIRVQRKKGIEVLQQLKERKKTIKTIPHPQS
jgi:transcription initiation factor TFIIIB Brf1 subunit/transcription initiation factor TFIIB